MQHARQVQIVWLDNIDLYVQVALMIKVVQEHALISHKMVNLFTPPLPVTIQHQVVHGGVILGIIKIGRAHV